MHRLRTAATLAQVMRLALQLAAWGACATTAWTQASTPARETAATVTVDVDSSAAWSVSERFLFRPDSTTSPHAMSSRGTFQYLARPCTSVESVVLVSGERSVPLTVSTNGPWRRLEDTSGISLNAALHDGFELRYRVTREGDDVDVPIILPTHPIPSDGGAQKGNAQILVRLPSAKGEVTFPRLARGGDERQWRALLVALPAFVNVRLSSTAVGCSRTLPVGDDGGLTWRFWLLVSILVTWVPTYQWWARRRTQDDA